MTNKQASSALSSKFCGIAASTRVAIDASMPRVAQTVSPDCAYRLILSDVQVLHNAEDIVSNEARS
jgi:hypothetical protein